MATYPKPTEGFNPGSGDGEDFGVIRIIDGHKPWAGGIDGANVHHPGDEFGGGGRQGLPVDNDEL